ncbi:MAG: CehA/McbA family metallohydrolase [Christensenellales bacterium]
MADLTQELQLHYGPDMAGRLLRIPFQVAGSVDSLHISYRYTRHREEDLGGGRRNRQEINIIDLALEGPGGCLAGASGSQRQDIVVHENHATPGYLPQPIREGTWNLILGLYRIDPSGCDVTVLIRQLPKQAVLLRGDVHLHSLHSDGGLSVEELVRLARQNGLDYLFLTDHNAMTSNEALPALEDLALLPGVEITYYGGHYNLLGLARPVKTFFANSRAEVLDIMREGRQAGALVSINHPVDNPCSWQFGLDEAVPFDCIEVLNGPPLAHNLRAVALWQEMLAAGRRVHALAGSDFHRQEPLRGLGSPCTFLYSASGSKSDILLALRQGHCFIGYTPEAPRIDLLCGEGLMGDICPAGEAIQIALSKMEAEDEVRLIGDAGPLMTAQAGATGWQFSWPSRGLRFLRVEIWRLMPGLGRMLASLSNPLYFA